MNKCFFIGNLTRNPELKTTQSGIAMCKFSIAVQRRFRNPDGEYDVDFFDVVAWRSTAEFCEKYFKKGSKVSVIGELNTSTYQGQDGKIRTSFHINADEVEILSVKNEETPQEDDIREKPSVVTKPSMKREITPVDEELPF